MSLGSDTPNPLPKLDTTTAIALGGTILGWASAFAGIRVGLTAFGPPELGSLRFTIAALPCAVLLAILRPAMPSRREFARIALRCWASSRRRSASSAA
jgi:hypothetical protein